MNESSAQRGSPYGPAQITLAFRVGCYNSGGSRGGLCPPSYPAFEQLKPKCVARV